MNNNNNENKKVSIPEDKPSGLIKGLAVALLIEGLFIAALIGIGNILSYL